MGTLLPLGGVFGAAPQPRAQQSQLGVLQPQPPSTPQAVRFSQRQVSAAPPALVPGSAAAGQPQGELRPALGDGGSLHVPRAGRPPAAAVAAAAGGGRSETPDPPPGLSALHAPGPARDAAAAGTWRSATAPTASSAQPGAAGGTAAVNDSAARSPNESAGLEANHAASSVQQHDLQAASGQPAPAAAHSGAAKPASAELGSAQSPVQPANIEAEPVSDSKLSRQPAAVDPVDAAPATGPPAAPETAAPATGPPTAPETAAPTTDPPAAPETAAPPPQEPASSQPAEARAAPRAGEERGRVPSDPGGEPSGTQPAPEAQSGAAPTQTIDVHKQAVLPQAQSHAAGRPAAGAHATGADVPTGGGPQLAAEAAKGSGGGALVSPAPAMPGMRAALLGFRPNRV